MSARDEGATHYFGDDCPGGHRAANVAGVDWDDQLTADEANVQDVAEVRTDAGLTVPVTRASIREIDKLIADIEHAPAEPSATAEMVLDTLRDARASLVRRLETLAAALARAKAQVDAAHDPSDRGQTPDALVALGQDSTTGTIPTEEPR